MLGGSAIAALHGVEEHAAVAQELLPVGEVHQVHIRGAGVTASDRCGTSHVCSCVEDCCE